VSARGEGSSVAHRRVLLPQTDRLAGGADSPGGARDGHGGRLGPRHRLWSGGRAVEAQPRKARGRPHDATELEHGSGNLATDAGPLSAAAGPPPIASRPSQNGSTLRGSTPTVGRSAEWAGPAPESRPGGLAWQSCRTPRH